MVMCVVYEENSGKVVSLVRGSNRVPGVSVGAGRKAAIVSKCPKWLETMDTLKAFKYLRVSNVNSNGTVDLEGPNAGKA